VIVQNNSLLEAANRRRPQIRGLDLQRDAAARLASSLGAVARRALLYVDARASGHGIAGQGDRTHEQASLSSSNPVLRSSREFRERSAHGESDLIQSPYPHPALRNVPRKAARTSGGRRLLPCG